MKKIIMRLCILAVCVSFFTGCMSIGAKNPEVVYTEIDSSEFNQNSFYKQISNGVNGFAVKNAILIDDEINDVRIDINLFEQHNPDFLDRIEYQKTYTFYLSVKKEGDFFSGYTYKPVLEKIEGLRSIEEIKTEQAEKTAEEEKAKAEKQKVRNEKASVLAKGYVYHGIDESDQNAKLFDSGALEAGHAYYISSYMIYAGGSMGGAIVSLFRNPNYQLVKYINQKVKGEVIDSAQTIFGELPISVVVAGGKAPMHIPVILGVVE